MSVQLLVRSTAETLLYTVNPESISSDLAFACLLVLLLTYLHVSR